MYSRGIESKHLTVYGHGPKPLLSLFHYRLLCLGFFFPLRRVLKQRALCPELVESNQVQPACRVQPR